MVKIANFGTMITQLFARLESIRPVQEQDRQLIANAFEPRAYGARDYLFRHNHICRELFFIGEGILRIVRTNERGLENTLFFVKENHFCTILPSFNDQVAAVDGIQAACYTEALAISRTRLFELYALAPYLKTTMDEIIQRHLLEKIAAHSAYLGQDSAQRYRMFLAQQPDIALRVPMSDIASYLEITPQSLSRIRRGMRRRQQQN
jgi:CRP/FNR family transcriptional regulator, anaerobic regulatory protein